MGRSSRPDSTTANLGFEATLWAAAAALRNNMDAAEYKHVVLGLIFRDDGRARTADHAARRDAGRMRKAVRCWAVGC